MLVLKRRKQQQITIDGDVVITILDVTRGTVSIGIVAPQQKKVYRTELLTREIPQETPHHASRSNPADVPPNDEPWQPAGTDSKG